MLQFSNYHLLILKIPSLKDEIDTRSPQQKKAMKVFLRAAIIGRLSLSLILIPSAIIIQGKNRTGV